MAKDEQELTLTEDDANFTGESTEGLMGGVIVDPEAEEPEGEEPVKADEQAKTEPAKEDDKAEKPVIDKERQKRDETAAKKERLELRDTVQQLTGSVQTLMQQNAELRELLNKPPVKEAEPEPDPLEKITSESTAEEVAIAMKAFAAKVKADAQVLRDENAKLQKQVDETRNESAIAREKREAAEGSQFVNNVIKECEKYYGTGFRKEALVAAAESLYSQGYRDPKQAARDGVPVKLPSEEKAELEIDRAYRRIAKEAEKTGKKPKTDLNPGRGGAGGGMQSAGNTTFLKDPPTMKQVLSERKALGG
jgi:hypothetical protein